VSGSGIGWAIWPYANLHSPQTDNHASIPPLGFLQAGCPFCRPANNVKALKAFLYMCWQVCYCYFTPEGVQSIVMSLFVSLSIRITWKPCSRTKICWVGPPMATLQYVVYFQFYGWHHISYHADSGQESSTMLCLKEVRQLSVAVECQTTRVFGRVHQNASLVVKSLIYIWLNLLSSSSSASVSASSALSCVYKPCSISCLIATVSAEWRSPSSLTIYLSDASLPRYSWRRGLKLIDSLLTWRTVKVQYNLMCVESTTKS